MKPPAVVMMALFTNPKDMERANKSIKTFLKFNYTIELRPALNAHSYSLDQIYGKFRADFNVTARNKQFPKSKFKAAIAYSRMKHFFQRMPPVLVVESDVVATSRWHALPRAAAHYDLIALHEHENGERRCKKTKKSVETKMMPGNSFYSPGSLLFFPTPERRRAALACLRHYPVGRPFAHWLASQKCLKFGSICPRPFLQTKQNSTY